MLEQFQESVSWVTNWLGERPLDSDLEVELARQFPRDGPEFQAIAQLCREGVEAGWLASRGEPPLKWGRVIKATPATGHFSVDVVEMEEVAGPQHAHPRGEIDMIIPIDAEATFDGRGAGWLVYPPGSAHQPTVAGGRAIILYLLPAGEIVFG